MIKNCTIGLRAHSGWAALVAVAGSLDAPEVIARRRIEIADPAIQGSKQPFHAAEPMPFRDAEKYLKECESSTRRLSREALRAAIDDLGNKRYKPVAFGVILGSGRVLPELRAILASHALIHTAEGEFFRMALLEAGEHCGLPVCGVKEREMHEHAAADKVQKRMAEIGRSLGPPWTQDQKYAALAGWMALGRGR